MTDLTLINNLKGDARINEKAVGFLYTNKSYREPIFFFLKSKGLSADDCQTLWTDIVVKFSSLVKNGKYEHQDKLIGYLKNLAGYLYLNFIRDNKKYKSENLESIVVKDEVLEAATKDNIELKELLNSQLSALKEMCKSILYLWASDYSMQEIMKELNLISEEATRKRKHICLKELLDKVHGNEKMLSLLKDYFYD